MELSKTGTAEREPIVLDEAVLPDVLRDAEDVSILVRRGDASFGDDLQDAVAINSGVDEDGRLDMDMLAAAEQAEAYLQGRQGQPVVLADMIRDEEGNLVRVDALLGVVGAGNKLVGTFEGPGRWRNGGIALQNGCYELSAHSGYGSFRHERTVAAKGGSAEGGLLPFDRQSLRLGHPEGENPQQTWSYTQELVAGEDIMQWVREQFGEGREAYEMWTGLLQGIRTPEAQRYLLHEPFTTMHAEELKRLDDISTELGRVGQKVSLHERAIVGALADASLTLMGIAEKAGPLAGRLPYSSERTSVVAEVTGAHDIQSRQTAVAQARQYLGGIVLPRPNA